MLTDIKRRYFTSSSCNVHDHISFARIKHACQQHKLYNLCKDCSELAKTREKLVYISRNSVNLLKNWCTPLYTSLNNNDLANEKASVLRL